MNYLSFYNLLPYCLLLAISHEITAKLLEQPKVERANGWAWKLADGQEIDALNKQKVLLQEVKHSDWKPVKANDELCSVKSNVCYRFKFLSPSDEHLTHMLEQANPTFWGNFFCNKMRNSDNRQTEYQYQFGRVQTFNDLLILQMWSFKIRAFTFAGYKNILATISNKNFKHPNIKVHMQELIASWDQHMQDKCLTLLSSKSRDASLLVQCNKRWNVRTVLCQRTVRRHVDFNPFQPLTMDVKGNRRREIAKRKSVQLNNNATNDDTRTAGLAFLMILQMAVTICFMAHLQHRFEDFASEISKFLKEKIEEDPSFALNMATLPKQQEVTKNQAVTGKENVSQADRRLQTAVTEENNDSDLLLKPRRYIPQLHSSHVEGTDPSEEPMKFFDPMRISMRDELTPEELHELDVKDAREVAERLFTNEDCNGGNVRNKRRRSFGKKKFSRTSIRKGIHNMIVSSSSQDIMPQGTTYKEQLQNTMENVKTPSLELQNDATDEEQPTKKSRSHSAKNYFRTISDSLQQSFLALKNDAIMKTKSYEDARRRQPPKGLKKFQSLTDWKTSSVEPFNNKMRKDRTEQQIGLTNQPQSGELFKIKPIIEENDSTEDLLDEGIEKVW